MNQDNSSETAALAKVEQHAAAVVQAQAKYDASDDLHVAKMLVKSGAFSDIRDAAQAMAKIQAGREMGFTAVQSMAGIHFIQGRLSMGANLIASAIKRSRHRRDINGYDYRVKTLSDDCCELEFFEIFSTTRRTTHPDGRVDQTPTVERVALGVSKFDGKDARRQSTKNMEKFPRNMLFARALTNGARWYTPDVFGGAVYTPDELGAEVDDVGRIKSVASREVGTVTIGIPKTSDGEVVDGEVVGSGRAAPKSPGLDGIKMATPAEDSKAQVFTSLQPKPGKGMAAKK